MSRLAVIGQVTRTIVGGALTAAVLSGCISGPDNKVTPNYTITPLPKNYKKIVTDYLKSRRKDNTPFQVGDAYQDSCRISANDKYYGWAVPITYGAEKARGTIGAKIARGTMPNEIIWLNHNSVQMFSNGALDECSKV